MSIDVAKTLKDRQEQVFEVLEKNIRGFKRKELNQRIIDLTHIFAYTTANIYCVDRNGEFDKKETRKEQNRVHRLKSLWTRKGILEKIHKEVFETTNQTPTPYTSSPDHLNEGENHRSSSSTSPEPNQTFSQEEGDHQHFLPLQLEDLLPNTQTSFDVQPPDLLNHWDKLPSDPTPQWKDQEDLKEQILKRAREIEGPEEPSAKILKREDSEVVDFDQFFAT